MKFEADMMRVIPYDSGDSVSHRLSRKRPLTYGGEENVRAANLPALYAQIIPNEENLLNWI